MCGLVYMLQASRSLSKHDSEADESDIKYVTPNHQ
jgi:hypothetical protein